MKMWVWKRHWRVYATSSSNRNVAVVRIYTPSENLRKLHEETIWMCVIDINHYHFIRVKVIFREKKIKFTVANIAD